MQSNYTSIPWPVTSLFLCLLIGAVRLAPAQTGKSDGNEVAELRAEVQRLSRELLQYRAELIHWKMQSLGAELRQVQTERQRLSAERQLIEREIGELNLASTNSPGAENEGRREELVNVQMPALLAAETAIAATEGTVAAALGAENTRLVEIRQRLRQMTPALQGHISLPDSRQ
jgi:hypothetical protein